MTQPPMPTPPANQVPATTVVQPPPQPMAQSIPSQQPVTYPQLVAANTQSFGMPSSQPTADQASYVAQPAQQQILQQAMAAPAAPTPVVNPQVGQLTQTYATERQQVSAAASTQAQISAAAAAAPITDVRPPQQMPTQPGSISVANEQPERIGNELGALEEAPNPVISDEQFQALANSAKQQVSLSQPGTNNTAMNSAQPRPIHDIKPAATAPVAATPTAPDSPMDNAPQPADASTNKSGVGVKLASAMATIAAVAIVSVYVWQINYPNLAVKVAAAKSGLAVSLPTYMPAGWRLSGNINASPGLVQYSLRSADGGQRVAITQSRSDWDSQALAENYLGKKTQQYLALQAQGLTIYVYGGNATWVNHGSWYKLEGTGQDINQDQIIKIATSL